MHTDLNPYPSPGDLEYRPSSSRCVPLHNLYVFDTYLCGVTKGIVNRTQYNYVSVQLGTKTVPNCTKNVQLGTVLVHNCTVYSDT